MRHGKAMTAVLAVVTMMVAGLVTVTPAVVWWRVRQRPMRTAKPRSPRRRRTSVVGAVVHVEDLVAGGLFVRGVHAGARALVAAVGECGQVVPPAR